MRTRERSRIPVSVFAILASVALISGCAGGANPSAARSAYSGETSTEAAAEPLAYAAAIPALPVYLPYAALVQRPAERRSADAVSRDRAECARLAREALARSSGRQPGKSCACEVFSAVDEFVPSPDDQASMRCKGRALYFSDNLGLNNADGYPLMAICAANSASITLQFNGTDHPFASLPEDCRSQVRATCPC